MGEVGEWQNWCGLEHARPDEVLAPADTGAVVEAVRRAREDGRTVRMVGSGHSFTGIGRPGDVMLRPDALTGIVAVDRAAMTVTARAGTRLADLNLGLERLGLSLHNMGDVAEQTLAGAVSTGTHGSGGVAAGLAAQLAGLELVTGTGRVLRADAAENPDVLDLARVGLGALGVLTTLTFRVEPLFVLEARERRAGWDELWESWDDLVADNHHVDAHWIPHTEHLQLKTNNRLAVSVGDVEPLAGWRRRLEVELLENTVLGAVMGVQDRLPAQGPRLNRAVAALVGERGYSDVAHRVFVRSRRIRFKEMEYAVPAGAARSVAAEVRRRMDASDWGIFFPLEIRHARADDVPLSTAYGRDTVYFAFHTTLRSDHRPYFAAMEEVVRAHDGRPHWGKLHQRSAEDLAPAYERWDDVMALRDRLDPDRVFTNDHLRRVLGP